MSTEKIINRIKNLLDMAKDAGSPKEAMIAARRARLLMDKHQIKKSDLTQNDEFLEFSDEFTRSRYPVWRKFLVATVARLNDCIAFIHGNRAGFNMGLQGFRSDVIIAQYMIDYLISRLDQLAKAAPGPDRNSYRLGFCDGISDQVDSIIDERQRADKSTNGSSLMIIKKELVEENFGKLPYDRKSNRSVASGSAFLDGYTSGRSQNLSAGVEQRNTATLLLSGRGVA